MGGMAFAAARFASVDVIVAEAVFEQWRNAEVFARRDHGGF